MAKYIKRETVLDYAYQIRPTVCDYFNIGIAEEMVLNREKEISDELGLLPYEEVNKEIWHDASKELPPKFVSVIGHMTDADPFPECRECYIVEDRFFFPALNEFHPVDYWIHFPICTN